MSFDVKFIRQEQKQRRNGEASQAETENTMSVYFDVKFIRQDQKQCRHGEACKASATCFWSSLINLISRDIYMVFYLSCIISRFNGEKAAKQMKSRHSFV